MLVDIFMAPVAPFQAPKMEPVVPNLMSGLVGSNPANAGKAPPATVTAAAVETKKWRRFSMAFPFICFLPTVYQEGELAAIAASSAGSGLCPLALQHKARRPCP